MKGTNWKYHWHILKEKFDMAEAKIRRLERKIKKYENNKSRRRVHTKRSAA